MRMCVQIAQVCDGIADCPEGDDETECGRSTSKVKHGVDKLGLHDPLLTLTFHSTDC